MLNLPTDLSSAYRYQFRQWLFAGTWRCSYELIGERGAMHLHVSGPHRFDGRDNWSAGLETHWRSAPEHMRNRPPSHDHCELMKCPCWHDGTSLYAQERYLPLVLAGDHATVFRLLVADADHNLSPVCEAA